MGGKINGKPDFQNAVGNRRVDILSIHKNVELWQSEIKIILEKV